MLYYNQIGGVMFFPVNMHCRNFPCRSYVMKSQAIIVQCLKELLRGSVVRDGKSTSEVATDFTGKASKPTNGSSDSEG